MHDRSSCLRSLVRIAAVYGCAAGLFSLVPTTLLSEDKQGGGQQLYKMHCLECHGPRGEGVKDKTKKPLRGLKSLVDLSKVIDETMPEDEPEQCSGEDAKKVARYIFDEFYKKELSGAKARSRFDLSHLTVRQYRTSIADIIGSMRGTGRVGDERGLSGQYFDERGFRQDKRVAQRIDAVVDFDFGPEGPHPKIKSPEEFSIRWDGSVLAEESGVYEFVLKTENGARLWVNHARTPLIDAWVSSRGRDKEHRATIRLLGGRAYPIRLDIFKYKEKSASVSLQWKPPHGPVEIIPKRHLSPTRVAPTFVVSASFPPDDHVSGYERGASVSRAWVEATTRGAIEAAQRIGDNLDGALQRVSGGGDRSERAKRLCRQFAELAFRRPLSDEDSHFFVDAHFGDSVEVEASVRRSVLLVLKSPRFLYPVRKRDGTDGYDTATRLSYGLWDSVPDRALLAAAAKDELRTVQQVSAQARRMLEDPRAKAKVRQFLHHWLQIDDVGGIAKDNELFPDFDEALIADLRTSLNLFLDDIVWSDSSDYRQLVLADSVYMNQRLARFFNVELPAGEGFRKVEFEPDKRRGVLTHPYLLSNLAYHNVSSPIHRGVFVSRRLLGRSLKPPPQAIEFKDADFDPHLTTREKVHILTRSAACQTCHVVINPIGFTLENFDAVGRYRKEEQGKPIDSKTIYSNANGKSIKLEGAGSLAQLIAGSQHAHGTFVDQLFHHAIKQPINVYGNARQNLVKHFVQSEYNVQELLVEIATTAALTRDPKETPQ